MSETASFVYCDGVARANACMCRGVVSNVASRYDLMNDSMSGGMHRLWKNLFVRRLKPRNHEQILDMAGGTGDIAFHLHHEGAAVTVADINPEMLGVGMERAKKRGLEGLVWAEENAESLSFPDRQFDAYTIAFGIRNITHIQQALEEDRKSTRLNSSH